MSLSDAGYLAKIGPPPLRFEKKIHANATSLLALTLRETHKPVPTAAPQEPPAPTPAAPSKAVPGEAPGHSQPAPLSSVPPSPARSNETPMGTDETWADLLKPAGGSSNGASVLVPLNFIPPQPAAPPDSKATYVSP